MQCQGLGPLALACYMKYARIRSLPLVDRIRSLSGVRSTASAVSLEHNAWALSQNSLVPRLSLTQDPDIVLEYGSGPNVY